MTSISFCYCDNNGFVFQRSAVLFIPIRNQMTCERQSSLLQICTFFSILTKVITKAFFCVDVFALVSTFLGGKVWVRDVLSLKTNSWCSSSVAFGIIRDLKVCFMLLPSDKIRVKKMSGRHMLMLWINSDYSTHFWSTWRFKRFKTQWSEMLTADSVGGDVKSLVMLEMDGRTSRGEGGETWTPSGDAWLMRDVPLQLFTGILTVSE